MYIGNPGIFRTLTHLKPNRYPEPSERFRMECFVKVVKNYSYFSKELYLRTLAGFWIRSSFNEYIFLWLTCGERPRAMYYKKRTQNPAGIRNHFIIVNLDIIRHIQVLFRHIEPCRGIFRTLCNLLIFRTLSYSESWHI